MDNVNHSFLVQPYLRSLRSGTFVLHVRYPHLLRLLGCIAVATVVAIQLPSLASGVRRFGIPDGHPSLSWATRLLCNGFTGKFSHFSLHTTGLQFTSTHDLLDPAISFGLLVYVFPYDVGVPCVGVSTPIPSYLVSSQ